MIWIIDKQLKESYKISGINVHITEDIAELWVTKDTGKTAKIEEDEDMNKIIEYANAINYAVDKGKRTFTI